MATRTTPSGPPAPSPPAGGRAPQRAPAVRVGPPPRERRPALLVGAVLLIVVSAAIITSLFLQVGNRTEVLAVARTVPIGRPIAVEDLKRVRIATDPGLHTIPVSAADQVIGKTAATTLLPGTLLAPEQLGASQLPAAGQAIVGLDLKGAQMPVPADQLQPGAKVRIIATLALGWTPRTGCWSTRPRSSACRPWRPATRSTSRWWSPTGRRAGCCARAPAARPGWWSCPPPPPPMAPRRHERDR